MSKDLLVLADEYAAATATFARALALKDEADSMSPIAREAGDKRAVLAEALAALDTAQQEPVNAMLVEALEKLLPMARRHGTLFSSSNPWTEACDIGDAALTAAKQAQPEPVNQVLLKALSAMLTHSGMDEDEWSKPTFDQARAAIMLATTKTQECGMCGYVGTKTDAVGQCPRCHWDELQAQPEPYGYHSPKTGKVYASTEAASMAMAGEVKTVYLAQPEPVNAMLVDALKALLSWVDAYAETSDAEFPDIEAKAEAALTAAKQAQPEPYGYHSPKTGKVYASTEAASMAMAGEVKTVYLATQAQPSQADAQDAARYRWLAGHCRSTSEHWGGRWSIVVDGPAPKSHDSEDDLDAAIDAAMTEAAHGIKEGGQQ